MIKIENENQYLENILEAMKTNDEAAIKDAWKGLHNSIAQTIRQDFEEYQVTNDEKILTERGYRQLTSKEKKFYEKFIEAAKSSNPKQALADLLSVDGAMPTTIIIDVYRDLKQEHPLLSKINFQYVQYLTKWLVNKHTSQLAVWGKVTDEITKEITSAFDEVDVTQNKLSAFAIIEISMLDLGPIFIDSYIRMVLKDALYLGLEYGAVDGDGKDSPIGLTRNVSKGVTVTAGVYPHKEVIQITSFDPQSYGELVAKLAKTEDGKNRKFESVSFICNQTDYLTKVMPATTVMNANGSYVNNLFPFPTEVIISNVLEDGKALLALLPEYFLGVGGSKDGIIEYDDSVKFLEDQRVYKVKQYADGRALDNTSAVYLDISKLDPAYITVVNKTQPEVTA